MDRALKAWRDRDDPRWPDLIAEAVKELDLSRCRLEVRRQSAAEHGAGSPVVVVEFRTLRGGSGPANEPDVPEPAGNRTS